MSSPPMAAEIVNIFETGDYDAQVGRAAQLLNDGGVVILPTETVYGAAGRLGHDKARGSPGTELEFAL